MVVEVDPMNAMPADADAGSKATTSKQSDSQSVLLFQPKIKRRRSDAPPPFCLTGNPLKRWLVAARTEEKSRLAQCSPGRVPREHSDAEQLLAGFLAIIDPPPDMLGPANQHRWVNFFSLYGDE